MKKIFGKKDKSQLASDLRNGGFIVLGALITVLVPYFIDKQFDIDSVPTDESSFQSSSYVEESKTDFSLDKSESTSKPTFPPYKSSVELLEELPINKEAYTLSGLDFEFDNKRDGTKTLRIMVSGDVKDINKYRIVPATAFKNGLIKKQIVDVEYGMICPEFFNVIAVLYNWDGDYITISKASIYTDQDHFSHIEVTFDNLDYGMYYVDFF